MFRQAAWACSLLGFYLLGLLQNASLASADPPGMGFVPGEVILKWKSDATDHDKAQIYAELGGTTRKGLGRTKAELRQIGMMSVEEAVARYRSHPKIEYIEPNYIVQAVEFPNDPRFPELYGLRNTGQTGGTADADIDATEAWDVFTGSQNVLIGVIDTGVDYNHPDLAANMWTNPGEIPGNSVDDDQNGYIDDVHGYDFVNNDGNPMDDNGHGSHCSGTIGGVGDNGVGVAGVSWSVKIMALKFLSANGSGNTAGAIEAVNYATMMGVRLTSNSWGGGGFSQGLLDAINAADAAGILFVAAAGNAHSNTDVSPYYPSSYASLNIVSVAATDHNDNLASFSNYGVTNVDLAAPGVNILSTTPGSTYSLLSGTSMATPHVSGALGLIFGRFPNIGHMDAKNLMLSSVDHKPSLAGTCLTGGRLNAFLPIADPDSIPPAAVNDLAVTGTTSNSAMLQWTAPGDDGNTGMPSSYVVKVSTGPITFANFDSAMTVSNPPDPGTAGTTETMEAGGLDINTTYYFAIAARDEFGNAGEVSNSPNGTTLGAPDADVTPASLTESLISGASSTQSLTLSNLGEGTLDFMIPLPGLITNEVSQQTFQSFGKGEVDPRVGTPVTENHGGPDGFGYRWVDSDDPSGPPFAWNDISGTGTTAISSGDDVNAGPFPIGFDFSFYGVSYDSFRVCSNGWLSFTSTSAMFLNQPLPNTGAPPNLVAPFWDDLNIAAGGTVRYQTSGNALTVQWNNVPLYGGGGPYTFQAVLHADGTINFYYLSVAEPLQSATIGLQNATGTDGLNIAYNVPYLHDDLAIRIEAIPQWLTVSPAAGRLYAPGSTTLDVNFASQGLSGGTYEADLRIQSNDPDEASVTVPVTLTVIGAPDINLAPTAHDFGNVFLNATPSTQVLVQNPGTDVLHVTEITLTGAGYTVSDSTFDVPAHGTRAMTVAFHPTEVTTYPATLTLTTNDPDEPLVSMTLSGEGAVPPAFSVGQTELSSTLPTGQSEMHELVLVNSGGAPLDFSIAPDMGIETVSYPDRELKKGEEDLGPGLLGSGGPDAFGYNWRDSNDPGGPAFSWIDLTSIGTPITNLTRDDQNSGPINLGFAFPFYGTHFQSVRVCTNGWLSFTSNTTVFSNAALPTTISNAPPNLIAPFWDDLQFRNAERARYLADGNKFIVQYTDVDKVDPTGASLTFQVILYPDGTILFQYLNMEGTLTSATMGIQNATRDVGLTIAHNTSYIHDNLAIRIKPAPNWLTVTPASGTIQPGTQMVLDVTMNASDLFGGIYEGALDITTNDPLASLVQVPASLQVTGAPNIQLSETSIDFGTVLVGYPKLREYDLINAGTDDLVVTGFTCNNAEFSPDLTGISLPLTLAPLTKTVVRARFAPTDPGKERGVIEIQSNDSDTPSAQLALEGLGQLPPAASAFPDSIAAALSTGQTHDEIVMLHNTGQGDLSFEIESHTSLSVESTPNDPEGIDPGKEEMDTRLGILGAGGPDLFGYRWSDSKAPDGPPYNWIDISTTGTPVFDTRSDDTNAGPYPIGFNVPFYGNVFDQVRICSNGWVSFTNTVSKDFSNDPLPSSNAPENLIGVFWDDLVVDPALGGQVYVLSEPTRFIVQWNNVQKYADQAGPRFTFQMILFRNGAVLTQYKALGTTSSSATIGLQNASRTVGLTVVYNQEYAEPNLAVRFSTSPDWLSATPMSGTVAPGSSLPLQTTMNATNLFGGVYHGELKILSNDPVNGVISLPASLSVTGVPHLELSLAVLDMGNVYIAYPESLSLVASNSGSDVLHVTAVTPGSPVFTVSPNSFDLEPYASRTIMVTFAPSSAGMQQTTLVIQSDDPASPDTVLLSGNGVAPPVITTEPATAVATASPGGQATETLTLCNTGGSELSVTLIPSWPEWLSVSPESATVPAGECVLLSMNMNATTLAPGDYNASIPIQSNDPGLPVDTTQVVFHVCQVQTAAIEVDPNAFGGEGQGNDVIAYIELPPGYDPALIDVSSVLLNGSVSASTETGSVGDWNLNGVTDFSVVFPRGAVEGALAEGDSVSVTVTGDIGDLCTFAGADAVRVIRPLLNYPDGGESFLAGTSLLVQWQNPENRTVGHAELHYSSDDGNSWTLVAGQIPGESHVWAAPQKATLEGRIRVVLFDSVGVMGYDSSNSPFAVHTSTTGITDVFPTVHRLYQNSPNPFQNMTRAVFDLPERGKVTVKVIDLNGRVVRVLADNLYQAGNHEVSWNARDAGGNPVAAGIYFLHIEIGSFSDTKRMYLQK